MVSHYRRKPEKIDSPTKEELDNSAQLEASLKKLFILTTACYDTPYILESNPRPFYSCRGLKNQMRITIVYRLDLQSRAGFWKNDGAAVRAVRTVQYNNLLFYLLNSLALVRERTILTERPPPVGEVSANFCG